MPYNTHTKIDQSERVRLSIYLDLFAVSYDREILRIYVL